ncbi:MAG: hypothetical protein U0X91_10935 [Spirosomataceae bacterium]
MKHVIYTVVCLLIFISCNPENHPIGPIWITGSWKLTEFKEHPDSNWKSVSNQEFIIQFRLNGSIKYKNSDNFYLRFPFDGGWCNKAERYELVKKRIYLQFGKPGCIPFADPKTPAFGVITELSGKQLNIDWWGSSFMFERN